MVPWPQELAEEMERSKGFRDRFEGMQPGRVTTELWNCEVWVKHRV